MFEASTQPFRFVKAHTSYRQMLFALVLVTTRINIGVNYLRIKEMPGEPGYEDGSAGVSDAQEPKKILSRLQTSSHPDWTFIAIACDDRHEVTMQ